jgi:hypothetical protein
MANIDYAGLLTGISGQNQQIDPFSLPSAAQQRMAFGAQQAQGMQRAGEGLFGMPSQQNPVDMAKTELLKLDRNDPEYQQKFIKLLGIADPAQAQEQLVRGQEQQRKVNIRNAVIKQIQDNPLYKDIVPLIAEGVYDDKPEDLISLLKKEPIKGASIIKPFAGQSSDGSPLMLTVLKREGQDDQVVEVSTGKPPPKGTTLSTADGTTVEVNLNEKTEDAFSKQLGEELAKDLIDSRDRATTSLLTADVLNNQWELIDNNIGILSGTGADLLRGAGKILSAAGVLSGEGEELIANTEAYLANAGNLVAEVITAFGSGTGLSDADRQFAIKMAAGDPSVLTEEGIRRILKLQARMTKFKIELHNKKVANSPASTSIYDMTVKVPEFPWAEPEKTASDVDAETQRLIDRYTGKEGG